MKTSEIISKLGRALRLLSTPRLVGERAHHWKELSGALWDRPSVFVFSVLLNRSQACSQDRELSHCDHLRQGQERPCLWVFGSTLFPSSVVLVLSTREQYLPVKPLTQEEAGHSFLMTPQNAPPSTSNCPERSLRPQLLHWLIAFYCPWKSLAAVEVRSLIPSAAEAAWIQLRGLCLVGPSLLLSGSHQLIRFLCAGAFFNLWYLVIGKGNPSKQRLQPSPRDSD